MSTLYHVLVRRLQMHRVYVRAESKDAAMNFARTISKERMPEGSIPLTDHLFGVQAWETTKNSDAKPSPDDIIWDITPHPVHLDPVTTPATITPAQSSIHYSQSMRDLQRRISTVRERYRGVSNVEAPITPERRPSPRRPEDHRAYGGPGS